MLLFIFLLIFLGTFSCGNSPLCFPKILHLLRSDSSSLKGPHLPRIGISTHRNDIFCSCTILEFQRRKVFCTRALQQRPVAAVVMSNIKWCSVAATPPPWLQNKQWQKMDVWMEGQNIHCGLRDRRHIHHGSRECGRSGYMPPELPTAHMKMAPGCSWCLWVSSWFWDKLNKYISMEIYSYGCWTVSHAGLGSCSVCFGWKHSVNIVALRYISLLTWSNTFHFSTVYVWVHNCHKLKSYWHWVEYIPPPQSVKLKNSYVD